MMNNSIPGMNDTMSMTGTNMSLMNLSGNASNMMGLGMNSSGNASDMMMGLRMLNFSADAEQGGALPSFKLEIDCSSPYMIITNGIWQGDDPLHYSLPLFLIQLLIITLTSRAIYVLIKPLRQPMVLSEILAGVLLGPSLVGRVSKGFQKHFFPPRSIGILSSMANVGLLCFVFMVGVEMDIKVLKQTKKKVMAIGTMSIVFPFAITSIATFLFRNYFAEEAKNGAFYIYLASALSVTAFPVLARILAELKLLSTEIGQISLLSSIVNEVLSWVLIAIVAACMGNGMSSQLILLCTLVFVLICVFFVQPVVKRLVHRVPEGEPMSDADFGLVIMGVMVAGFAADSIGIHSVFGAFIYGLVFPHGIHGTALVERLDFFVTGLLLPLYFGITGFKTDLSKINNSNVVATLIFLFILSSIAKVVVTTLVSLYFSMPLAKGLSLGFLMNSPGLAEVVLLNAARDQDLIEPETFAIIVVMSIVMTALVTPLVKAAVKPMRQPAEYKHRTLMGAMPNTELRMLTCVHCSSNVPSVISLLDMSNPTNRSPISVSVLHLTELKGRESALLIVHDTGSKSSTAGGSSINRTQAQANQIISVFETYEQQHAGSVSIQALTVISPYATMHDDICTIAADKHTAMIILPFHKIHTVVGGMESDHTIRAVNKGVLKHAPCSVAILVDRGVSSRKPAKNPSLHPTLRVVLLFFGGPDDREALAYVWRMAEHPSINLTVMRFVNGEEPAAVVPQCHSLVPSSDTNKLLRDSSVITIGNLEADPDKVLDEEYITDFRMNLVDESIEYMEKVVNNSEEMVAVITAIDRRHDLYVVGRSQGNSPLMAGLTEWAEYPELGTIGDLLASADFGEALSVLVVQQYTGAGVIRRDDNIDDEPAALVQPSTEKSLQQCVGGANLGAGGERRASGGFSSVAGDMEFETSTNIHHW